MSSPIILFTYNDDEKMEQLIPVAILLRPHISDSKVFTRIDGEWAWLAAKMYAMAADKNYQQLIAHVLDIHLTHGVIAVSYKRNLAAIHPVYQLLTNHFIGAVSVELFTRVGQIDVNTEHIDDISEKPIQYIMASSVFHHHNISLVYKKWNFHLLNLRKDLKNRGLLPSSSSLNNNNNNNNNSNNNNNHDLKNYYYAEDGLLVWDAIYTYIHDTLSVHYHGEDADKLVAEDVELQEFWKYLIEVGFDGSATNYYKLNALAELCDSLTTMIWIVSGFHNTISTPLFEWSSFPPFRPMAMFKSAETFENEYKNVDEKWICDALPDGLRSFMQVFAYFGLSQKSSTDHGLGKQVQQMNYEDEGVRVAATQFMKNLQNIEQEVKLRNTTRIIPSSYLQPSEIPNYAV